MKGKKKTKKIKVERTRNSGTMTESGFWSFIRSALRQKSRWWKPIMETKNACRRDYVGTNKRQKYEYQCSICKQWHAGKDVEVDHIVPAGSLTNGDDLKGFIERLFCEKEFLRCLCKTCHQKVTNESKEKEIDAE